MKSNEELQKNVVDAINWEPLLEAAEIGVMANEGSITLSGSVNTYAKKSEAGYAAKNVAGVQTVYEDINVVCDELDIRSDAEIMTAIQSAFKWNWDIPSEKITVVVEKGWVYLSGVLEWNYQKEATKNAVCLLIGITGITDRITILSSSKDKIEKKDIEISIRRNRSLNNKNIAIFVFDNVVTLKGTVDTWFQKSEVGRIAWNASGVKQVQNDLFVNCKE